METITGTRWQRQGGCAQRQGGCAQTILKVAVGAETAVVVIDVVDKAEAVARERGGSVGQRVSVRRLSKQDKTDMLITRQLTTPRNCYLVLA